MTAKLNSTTGGPYTYSQSKHHFYGTGFDGSYIDTTGCCCGQSGSCRNNPSCQVIYIYDLCYRRCNDRMTD